MEASRRAPAAGVKILVRRRSRIDNERERATDRVERTHLGRDLILKPTELALVAANLAGAVGAAEALARPVEDGLDAGVLVVLVGESIFLTQREVVGLARALGNSDALVAEQRLELADAGAGGL